VTPGNKGDGALSKSWGGEARILTSRGNGLIADRESSLRRKKPTAKAASETHRIPVRQKKKKLSKSLTVLGMSERVINRGKNKIHRNGVPKRGGKSDLRSTT